MRYEYNLVLNEATTKKIDLSRLPYQLFVSVANFDFRMGVYNGSHARMEARNVEYSSLACRRTAYANVSATIARSAFIILTKTIIMMQDKKQTVKNIIQLNI